MKISKKLLILLMMLAVCLSSCAQKASKAGAVKDIERPKSFR